MNAIDKIVEKLKKYPGITYKIENDSISVDPTTKSGFSVLFKINNTGFTVGFDGWHEEFQDETEAMNAFAFGLSDRCRLKVIKRGGADCKWVVEAKDGNEWIEDSASGLIFVPFWKKKSIEYRQNSIIRASTYNPRPKYFF